MTVRLRQLEAFHAVSELGSVTGAANKLNISQPAVSRLLSSYSESVGFKLFDRRNSRLVPTQESRLLLREVGRLLDSLSHINELTHNLTARKVGHLRIACLPGFSTSHMPGVLARFLNHRPDVTVTLEPDRPDRIFEWIIGEQYDCGITDSFSDHPAVECERIPMRTVCVMADGNPLAKNKVIVPEDLRGEPMVHTRRDSVFFKELSEVFASRNVEINSWIETRQFTAACKLIIEGTGVSIVSEMDAREYQGRGLTIRPFEPEVPHVLMLVRPTHAASSLLVLEFMEYFAASLDPFRLPSVP